MIAILDEIRGHHPQHLFLVLLDGVVLAEASDLLPDLTITMEQNDLLINVSKNVILEWPLHIVSIQTGELTLAKKINLQSGSKLCLIEEFISTGAKSLLHSTTEITTYQNSFLDCYYVQRNHSPMSHHAKIHIKQLRDSKVERFSFIKGNQFSGETVTVDLAETGAACQLRSLYSLKEQQQTEHALVVNHQAEHCQSAMLYKGILGGKSNAAFKGKVHVHPQAQKTQAFQANHHLLLTNEAQATSKPELEIYADDVKCTHGATTGQLDQEALFYMRSRGIDQDSAKAFLLNAFADEVISQVKNKDILHYMSRLLHE